MYMGFIETKFSNSWFLDMRKRVELLVLGEDERDILFQTVYKCTYLHVC